MTVHRAAATDTREALAALVDLLEAVDEPAVFPVHPRTRHKLEEAGMWERLAGHPSLRLSPPVGYLDFTALLMSARAVVTDSGGVQKEAYFHGVPCVTLRDTTEWVETVEGGFNTLVGMDVPRLRAALADLSMPAERPPFYGDGDAADRIAEAVVGARRGLSLDLEVEGAGLHGAVVVAAGPGGLEDGCRAEPRREGVGADEREDAGLAVPLGGVPAGRPRSSPPTPRLPRSPATRPAMIPPPPVKRSKTSRAMIPVSTMPASFRRRSRELASVSWTEARGGGPASRRRSRMRRPLASEATNSVGSATASAARAVAPGRTGSPRSQVQSQNTTTTMAVATAAWPLQRVSSATRTSRGSPARTDSGLRSCPFGCVSRWLR